ncbi:hypothetical protein V6N12_050111 [Hibiscus sabdariffa]|uniref:Uncharacterized protein n=1 Tax=Hibiscus sabdariffa TaxID=183260 RepID=A0ABR2GC10_9ROSI
MFSSLHDWLLANIGNSSILGIGDVEWYGCFSVNSWLIWKRRCCLLFDDKYVERTDFISHGLRIAAEFVEGLRKVETHRRLHTDVPPIWHAWTLGWVKANADGIVDIRSGVAASGGVLHDEHG